MKSNTFEIRSGGDLRVFSSGKLAGYAAVYDSQSQDLGGFVEIIRKGAFTRALKTPNAIRALYEHDNQKILGRVGAGTLTLEEKNKGLYFELCLPDTSYARDLGILVERGDINGCSFGFQIPAGGDLWEMRNGQLTRDLITINLQEITITSNPAYLDTNVAVRSMEAWQKENHSQAFVDLNQSFWMTTV